MPAAERRLGALARQVAAPPASSEGPPPPSREPQGQRPMGQLQEIKGKTANNFGSKEERPQSRMSRVSGPEDLTPSAHLRTLEADDIAFFKEHGCPSPAPPPTPPVLALTTPPALALTTPRRYLIKKGLLDPEKTSAAMAKVWDVLEGTDLQFVPGISLESHQHSVSPGISRHDPRSWVGGSVNHDGKHGGGLRSLGHLDWMRDLVPYDQHVRAMATAFLGPLRENRRVRGVYPIFPKSDEHLKAGAKDPKAAEDDHIGQPGLSASELGPHNDGQVCQLNAMCCKCSRFLCVFFRSSKQRLHRPRRGRAARGWYCK